MNSAAPPLGLEWASGEERLIILPDSAEVGSAEMSSLRKMLSILDLFSAAEMALGADEIAQRLGFARTTGYRYVRELCNAGLLARVSGQYALGPRVIELDYQIRRSDPVLRAALTPMQDLVEQTGLNLLLSRVYDMQVLNVHQETGREPTRLDYGRGRPMPLFRSASSKIILAHMKRGQLKRIYERHRDDPDRRQIGDGWKDFARALLQIRQRGYCITSGELNEGVVGLSVALCQEDGDVLGSVTLIGSEKRFELFSESTLADTLRSTVSGIAEKLRHLGEDIRVDSPPSTFSAAARF